MKIQCACGAKYAFDATPEMLQNPVKFVCPGCGLDSSDFVNELIRREFAGQTSPAPLPTETPRLKIAHAEPQPSAPVEAASDSPGGGTSIALNIPASWPCIIAWFAGSRCAANA